MSGPGQDYGHCACLLSLLQIATEEARVGRGGLCDLGENGNNGLSQRALGQMCFESKTPHSRLKHSILMFDVR